MGFPAQIDVHAQVTFDREMRVQTQHATSAFRFSVLEEELDGEKRYFDGYGSAEMIERRFRGEPNVPQELFRTRRLIAPRDFEFTEEYDFAKDEIRVRNDMKVDSEYQQAVVATVGREIDNLIVEATHGDAAGGKNGELTFQFDVANETITSTTVGDLIARDARKRLKATDAVTGHDLVAQVSDQMWNQVFNNPSGASGTVQVGSIDTNVRKAMVDHEFRRWLGFDWYRRSNQPILAFAVGAFPLSRYEVFRTRDSIAFAMDPVVNAGWEKLPGRGDTWQYAVYLTMAASRLYEDRVFRYLLPYTETLLT